MTAGELLESAVDDPAGAPEARIPGQAGVILTAAAQDKIQALLAREDRDDLRLRVAVQPGGCSGLRYKLYFDDRLADGDSVFRFGSAGPARQGSSDPSPGPGEGRGTRYEGGHDE